MRLLSIILALLPLLSLSFSEATIETTTSPSTRQATIHYHILKPNTSPSPLTELTYHTSPTFEGPKPPNVDSFTPPPAPSIPVGGGNVTEQEQELIQIGIYDKNTGGLRPPTIVLATSAFSQQPGQGRGHFRIHLTSDGESVWSASYHNLPPSATTTTTAGTDGKGLPTFEIVYPKQGPRPVLNKPVALTKEGKVVGKEEVDERGFIQKYWWVFLGVAVLAMAGGGGDGK
ncbi:MAG: hypothetical protein MMC33_006966 [Icmadophila ericetorum]|nr:hypothetical protein [Icmadophila ericetorum]